MGRLILAFRRLPLTMYTPPAFKMDDRKTLHEFIRKHSFATVISHSAADTQVSHLPLLLDPQSGTSGRLIGHMARANGHWKMAADNDVLAIFHGPHAYITPSWYEEKNVVPTWNYTAVHVSGILQLETHAERLQQILTQYVETYESALPEPWSLDAVDDDFRDQLTQAIVGFTIDIDRIEGKWKLSQNHSEDRRQRVIAGLQNRQLPGDGDVAALMQEQIDHHVQ